MRRAFERAHKARFGFLDPAKSIAIEAVSAEAARRSGALCRDAPRRIAPKALLATAARATRFFSKGAWRKAEVHLREALPAGAAIDGPALIVEPHQTIVVEHGWRAAITAKNHVLMTRVEPVPQREAIGAKADPVMLEIFNNLFMSIAEQMGVTLQNTAYSVNIKERLDFSCAVFDRDGRLVANAPHMPVHLGSMDRSVETIIRDNAGRIRPGDVFALNAPYNGGTHLPDITVCTPVFDEASKTILFWTASRGHHADIGGIAPGSMTPARDLDPRGGRLHRQFPAGRPRPFPRARALRPAGERPLSRAQSVAERQRPQGADRRQREGRARTQAHGRACSRFATVEAYMGHVQDNADESVRRVIDRLADSEADERFRPGRDHQGQDHRRQDRSARRPSTSPARRRSSRPTSTRPSRSPARRCSMCSG